MSKQRTQAMHSAQRHAAQKAEEAGKRNFHGMYGAELLELPWLRIPDRSERRLLDGSAAGVRLVLDQFWPLREAGSGMPIA